MRVKLRHPNFRRRTKEKKKKKFRTLYVKTTTHTAQGWNSQIRNMNCCRAVIQWDGRKESSKEESGCPVDS